MKKKFNTFLVLLILVFSSQGFSQNYLEKTLTHQYSPDQIVTFAASLPFNDAIALISKVSQKTAGIKVISTVDRNDPVGVEITNMYFEKALDLIVKYAGLIYERQNDMIVVKQKVESEIKKDASTYASVDARDVKISAIFFDSDVIKARQMGINWQVLLSKNGLDLGGQLGSSKNNFAPDSTFNGGQFTGNSSFNLGQFAGNATALFQFLESENVGQVITAPSTTVRDGFRWVPIFR
jgi:hypothetical protein